MFQELVLQVNGEERRLQADPETPLLIILRQDLGLKGPKMGCGLEQCGACKVLVDGQATPSCRLPVGHVQNMNIITVEGLSSADSPHPLQEAFLEEQAGQCGYCMSGMIIAAQGLLNRLRYPTDEQIREALADNLCRCGVYERVRRAIKLRVGRPDPEPVYTMRELFPATEATVRPAPLSRSLIGSPALDDWLRLESDGTLTVFTGKVELGQGLKTALAQIVAEELDVSLSRIRVVTADTALTPDEGRTVGSMSLETSGNALRLAAAEARHYLLSLAVEELELQTPAEQLQVDDGTIMDAKTGLTTDYWRLMGGRRFGRRISGRIPPKNAAAYHLVGRPVQRLDLPAKAAGLPVYVPDLALPGMVHGCVVRPPHTTAELVGADIAVVEQMPGVLRVVRDGSFLGVIAEREEQAVNAAEALRLGCVWAGEAALPPQEELTNLLLATPGKKFLLQDGTPTMEKVPPIAAPTEAVRILQATYTRPYIMHAALGPSAAAALIGEGRLTVWAHTQGAFPPRAALAHALGMPLDAIRVRHVEGAGCYGHNGADDAALDAALLARALPGRPVLVMWSREDENKWEPYGPPAALKLQAGLDADGRVVDWNHDVYGYSHFGRPGTEGETSGLLAAWHLAQPFARPTPAPTMWRHAGIHRNADPLYAFQRRRVVKHFVPDSPLRASSLRGLGAFANVFAIESFMDELAHAAGSDPVAFRLRHLHDERAAAVIETAVDTAEQWSPGASGEQEHAVRRGRGLAFAQYKNQQCYTAVVVDVAVDVSSGEIRLERAVIAADAGQVVNPDGLSNQLEGGFTQSASWTLKEQVNWNADGVTSLDWESYPILTFPETPPVRVVLLNRPGLPFLGSGEAAQGPTPAAIANAVFNAAGVRLRDLPLTPERVRQALGERENAGSANPES